MERAQRLYDCITEIGDSYLQEAERFQPQKKAVTVDWRRWGSWAAAVVLVLGLGRLALGNLPKMGASASAPNAATPAASAPCASANTPAETTGEETQSGGSWASQFAGDDPCCASYRDLVQISDVIVEGTVTAVTPDVELEIGADPDSACYLTVTVVELEVSDVLKGDVEAGETIQLKYPQSEEWDIIPVQEGDRNIYFLADNRDNSPGVPFSPVNLSQAVVPIDGDTVLADGGMLGREEQSVSMDKEDFKDLVRQALEEE